MTDEQRADYRRRMEVIGIKERGGLRRPTVSEARDVERNTVREGKGMADYPLEVWLLAGVPKERLGL